MERGEKSNSSLSAEQKKVLKSGITDRKSALDGCFVDDGSIELFISSPPSLSDGGAVSPSQLLNLVTLSITINCQNKCVYKQWRKHHDTPTRGRKALLCATPEHFPLIRAS
jgi:hypothetical protein